MPETTEQTGAGNTELAKHAGETIRPHLSFRPTRLPIPTNGAGLSFIRRPAGKLPVVTDAELACW